MMEKPFDTWDSSVSMISIIQSQRANVLLKKKLAFEKMHVDAQNYFVSYDGGGGIRHKHLLYGCMTVGQMSMLEIDMVSTTLPNTQALIDLLTE